MKKLYLLTVFFIAVIGFTPISCFSQICDGTTPVFNVDLTGNPNGSWTSPGISRNGLCCGDTSNDKCIEFIVTLDSAAGGIRFDIVSGAIPSGSLFYQVDCGPPAVVGQYICLNGVGPHYVTFCKPGNNTNTYQISSAPEPSLSGTQWVSQACSGTMIATGLVDTSIHWTSVPYNATYNSYLSCTDGCDTVIINAPGGSLPPSITYQVCGNIIAGCNPFSFCDTITVNFVNDLAVNILPKNPVICFGGSNATVTANQSGGHAPYKFNWSNGTTTSSIAVGAGTYIVTLTDAMNCSVATDTVIVTAVTSQIVANAGPDQLFCTNQKTVNLNGIINTADGGQWKGGAGTYSPNDTTRNAIYTPSAAEISTGTASLTLVTTGNHGCPADSDVMVINISHSPAPAITGTISTCELTDYTYTTGFFSGDTYVWSISGGSVVSTSNNSITVHWTAPGTGTVTVTETNSAGCDSTVSLSVTINPKPHPIVNGPSTTCTTTTTAFAVANPAAGDTYQWNVTGGIISGSSTNSSVNVQWSTAGSASVSVTVSNNQGCDSTITRNVIVLTMPTPVISGPAGVCAGDAFTYSATSVLGNTYTWNVTGGNVLSINNNAITVKWQNAGTGTVTLTEANTSTCDSTVTLTVTVHANPAPVITGPPTACTTTQTSFAVANPVAGDTYQWNVSGGAISGSSTGSSINVQWSTIGTATITVTETNIYGCDSTISINVNVMKMPTPVIAGPSPVCAGQVFTYSSSFIFGNSYSWNVSGGTVLSTNNNAITVLWPNAGGTGTITLTEANTATCDSTVSINVTIIANPAPVITGPLNVCTTTTSTFAVASPGAGDTYQWFVVGGMITGSSTSSSVNVQWSSPANATISVTETNSYGCDSTYTIHVNVLTMPHPVISGPSGFCEGLTYTYSTPLFPGNSYSWNVSGGAVMAVNNNSITVKWPSAGTGTITLTEANTATCDSTVSINVVVNPNPTPVISGPAFACTSTGSTYILTNPTAGSTYNWSLSGGTPIGGTTGTSLDVRWINGGNAIISLTEVNSYGCDSTVTINATIMPKPAPRLNGPQGVCIMDTATYFVTPYVPGDFYNWNVIGGSIIGFGVGDSIQVLWSSIGQGQVIVQEIAPSGCDSSMKRLVNVNPLPSPSIVGPASVCGKETAQYQVANEDGGYYSWNVSAGTVHGTPTANLINVTMPASGSTTIELTETTPNGCINKATAHIQVPPKPTPMISGSNLGCISPNQSAYNTLFVPGTNYQWTVSGGVINYGNGTNSISVTWNGAGAQQVTVTALNTTTGCDSSVTFKVMVDSLAKPVIQAPDMYGCAPFSAVFTGNTYSSNYHYTWTFGDGYTNFSVSPSHKYTSPGTYPVKLVMTNNTGCADTATALVNVYPSPDAGFNMHYSPDIYYAGSELSLNNTSAGASSYSWDFGNGDNSTVFEPDYKYATRGTYTITLAVVNQYGCRDVTQQRLEVKVPEDLYIPNAFTPNGDGNNNNFFVVTKNITAMHIDIFNRWGEQIYSSDDPAFQWDGLYLGKPVQDGVYVYLLKATGEEGTSFTRQGTVTVLK